MSIDKKIEQTMIEEMLLVERFRKQQQGELPENIDIEEEYLEQQLSTGEARNLIQELLVNKLTEQEKLVYLEFSTVQDKIYNLLPEFNEALSELQARRVVEQSNYSEAKIKKQLH